MVDKCQSAATKVDNPEMGSVIHSTNERGFIYWLALFFMLGAFLRLYMLSDQILIDDEWHSISFSIGKTFLNTLTAINPIDNSSPLLNAYTVLIYNTLGISELYLRLPVVLVGLISLIVLPLSIKKLYGSRVAIMFSALFAISPFLIFYSRFFRAYILIMFFSFLGLLSFLSWITIGHRRYAFLTVLSGAIATYLHPSSIIVVMIPFVISLLIIFSKNYFPQFFNSLGIVLFKRQFFILFLMTALLALLSLWPILAHRSELPLFKDALSAGGLAAALSLLCGTSNIFLIVTLALLLVSGQVIIIIRQPLTGLILAGVIMAYLLFLAITRPFGVGNGVVILRYMISAVPIGLLLISLALEHFYKILESKPFLSLNIKVRFARMLFPGFYWNTIRTWSNSQYI